MPAPKLCPNCRQQERLAWRNERQLYHQTCDLCKKNTISVYHKESPFIVYCQECWWSDHWNPIEYEREFDFERSFFEQFCELMIKVPRPAILNRNSENSEYTHICENNRNCYLLVESSTNENCLYGYWIQKSKHCVDCSHCNECEWCYECENCKQGYNLFFSQNCQTCSDSWFLKNCIGCKNCFGCANLHHKEFYIFNEPHSKEEYGKKIITLKPHTYPEVIKTKQTFEKWRQEQFYKYAEITSSENCTGDYISESKDCYECYNASQARDCRYSHHVWRDTKDNMDVDTVGMNSDLNYQCINTAINSHHNLGCARCWGVSDSYYSNECDYSQNLFGCIGLRHKKYCIFNKQYSKKEYHRMVERIVKHMVKTGEWGLFFPRNLSPFGYNETVAQERFPLQKENAERLGFKWSDVKTEPPEAKKKIQSSKLPDSIELIPDDILNWAIECEDSKTPFKITAQELLFYRKKGLPIPHLHPDIRHKKRMKLRNPQKLHHRKCAKCQSEIQTTYSPDRSEIVYCEHCYLKNIY